MARKRRMPATTGDGTDTLEPFEAAPVPDGTASALETFDEAEMREYMVKMRGQSRKRRSLLIAWMHSAAAAKAAKQAYDTAVAESLEMEDSLDEPPLPLFPPKADSNGQHEPSIPAEAEAESRADEDEPPLLGLGRDGRMTMIPPPRPRPRPSPEADDDAPPLTGPFDHLADDMAVTGPRIPSVEGPEWRDTPIAELKLTRHVGRALKAMGVHTLGLLETRLYAGTLGTSGKLRPEQIEALRETLETWLASRANDDGSASPESEPAEADPSWPEQATQDRPGRDDGDGDRFSDVRREGSPAGRIGDPGASV